MPPMRDRQTRARHVRGYVTQGKTDSYGTPTAKYATARPWPPWATEAAKKPPSGGTDPEGEYAQGRRTELGANKRRAASGVALSYRVLVENSCRRRGLDFTGSGCAVDKDYNEGVMNELCTHEH